MAPEVEVEMLVENLEDCQATATSLALTMLRWLAKHKLHELSKIGKMNMHNSNWGSWIGLNTVGI